jgi:hypothetical protein
VIRGKESTGERRRRKKEKKGGKERRRRNRIRGGHAPSPQIAQLSLYRRPTCSQSPFQMILQVCPGEQRMCRIYTKSGKEGEANAAVSEQTK